MEFKALSKKREKIIVALDTQDNEEFLKLCYALKGEASYVKVGMELFYTKGIESIKILKELGFKVFLDLKMHDIPNTVLKAVKTLTRLRVDMINIHAAGGSEVMKAARIGREQGVKEYKISTPPLLIAVTQLTSTNQEILEEDLLIHQNLESVVAHYAFKAKEAGLDGVVASAHEVPLIKERCGENFITVTPGIRPKGSQNHDQKRVMTPREAFSNGSDYLVIGRAITQAIDPKQAFMNIVKEIENE